MRGSLLAQTPLECTAKGFSKDGQVVFTNLQSVQMAGSLVKGWGSRKKFIRMACPESSIFQPAEGGKPPRNFSGCLLGAHIDGRGTEKSLPS